MSDVSCNLFFIWVYTVSCLSRSWACRTAGRGHNIWFRSPGRVSFPPAPPPTSPCLSPSLLVGWLATGRVRHAEMRSCKAQDSAQEEQRPEQRRKRGPGNAAMGQADQDRNSVQRHDGKTTKMMQNCSVVERRCSGWWRRASTRKDEESSIQRSCPSVEEWRRGARLSVEKRVEGRWW